MELGDSDPQGKIYALNGQNGGWIRELEAKEDSMRRRWRCSTKGMLSHVQVMQA